MAKKISFTVTLLVLIVASTSKPNVNKCKDDEDDNAMSRFVYANTALNGEYLYQHLLQYPNKSYTVVTLPIGCFLGQLALHVKGKKHKKILQRLGLRNKNEIKAVLPRAVSEINDLNKSDTVSKITFKVFGDDCEKFTDGFEQDFIDICHGESGYVDNDCPDEALKEVAQWFDQQSETYPVIPLDDASMFHENDKQGIVFATYMDFITSFDHEANPNGLVDVDFQVSKCKSFKFPSLYGNGYFKYADLHELDAQLIMITLKGGKHYAMFYYPNNPDNLGKLMEKLQDPEVWYDGINRAEWMCLKVHLTIGHAHVNNDLLEFVPDLCLNETDFDDVFRCGAPAHVNYGFQQLNLIADTEVRQGELNSKLCPGDDLPFVKMNHACAYYVMAENGMIVYGGLIYGPQDYEEV